MVSLAVSAGGKSERMGQDKALMPFLGRPLIVRIIERLTPMVNEIIVVTNRPMNYKSLNLPIYPDLQDGYGALGGLYTALGAAKYPLVAIVACDMPFASLSLFKHENDLMIATGADVVIPSTPEGMEPLHAIYRRATCLPAIEHALEIGELKIISWFQEVKVQTLPPEDVAKFDPRGLAFLNLNTPEEFEQAECLAKQIGDY